jgi:hypothetical protein
MFNQTKSNFSNLVENRPNRSPKKKKRKYNIDQLGSNTILPSHSGFSIHNAFENNLISIIDRSLDLSKYKENDSL